MSFYHPENHSVLVSIEDAATIERTFGVTDNKGREIGVRVQIKTVTRRAMTDEELAGFATRGVENMKWGKPGRFFVMHTSATRAGKDFGPAFNTREFESETDRAAALLKYLTAAERRAAKEAAKGARA